MVADKALTRFRTLRVLWNDNSSRQFEPVLLLSIISFVVGDWILRVAGKDEPLIRAAVYRQFICIHSSVRTDCKLYHRS